MDAINISLYFSAFGVRASGSASGESSILAKTLLEANFILLVVRVLRYFAAFQELGPKV